MPNLIVESVPRSQTGVASGMNTNIRTVGGAIGGAVSASVVTAGAAANGFPVESGYTAAFGMLAVVALLAALMAVFIPAIRAPQFQLADAPIRHPVGAGARS